MFLSFRSIRWYSTWVSVFTFPSPSELLRFLKSSLLALLCYFNWPAPLGGQLNYCHWLPPEHKVNHGPNGLWEMSLSASRTPLRNWYVDTAIACNLDTFYYILKYDWLFEYYQFEWLSINLVELVKGQDHTQFNFQLHLFFQIWFLLRLFSLVHCIMCFPSDVEIANEANTLQVEKSFWLSCPISHLQ